MEKIGWMSELWGGRVWWKSCEMMGGNRSLLDSQPQASGWFRWFELLVQPMVGILWLGRDFIKVTSSTTKPYRIHWHVRVGHSLQEGGWALHTLRWAKWSDCHLKKWVMFWGNSQEITSSGFDFDWNIYIYISVYTAYSDSHELLVVVWWSCFGGGVLVLPSFLPSFLPANLPACFPACQLAFCSCSLMFSNAQNNLFDPTPNVYKGHLRRGPALPSSCQDFQMI